MLQRVALNFFEPDVLPPRVLELHTSLFLVFNLLPPLGFESVLSWFVALIWLLISSWLLPCLGLLFSTYVYVHTHVHKCKHVFTCMHTHISP